MKRAFATPLVSIAILVALVVSTSLLTRRRGKRRNRSAPPPLPFGISEPPKPPVQGPPTLDGLTWDDFEVVITELYRRSGHTVEIVAGDGGDGGYDLVATKDGVRTLVQCKHRPSGGKVPVPVVRELIGARVAEKATAAAVVTSSAFTRDAEELARAQGIELIGREDVEAWIARETTRGGINPLDVASWIDEFRREAIIKTPACPFCHSKMVVRTAVPRKFWGCPSYPRCRGVRELKRWLT